MLALRLAGRPGERTTADQVNVHVENRLSGARSDIQNGAVSILNFALAGDFCSSQMALSDDIGVIGLSFLQPGEMAFGNHEHMRGSLRLNVFEREDVVVFIDFFRGNLSADDAAEKAVRVGHLFTCVSLSKDNTGKSGSWLVTSAQ